jgi:putative nucleotidyltransferase with HDIG domain
MLSRNEGLTLLKKYLRNENLRKHSFAVEAILREIACRLQKDEELWALTGLLHDLDYEYTKEKPEKHATTTAEILNEMLPKEATDAIKAHNYKHTMQIPQTHLDKALITADAVSGLIIAAALVMPSKKLADVKPTTLRNKYKDKSFAAGCNRKRIDLCEDIGLELDDFLEISLTALKNISDQLGL